MGWERFAPIRVPGKTGCHVLVGEDAPGGSRRDPQGSSREPVNPLQSPEST